jgi:excisionase family DNA binding protein
MNGATLAPATDILLHDVPETVQILRVGRSTVYQLIKDRELTTVKLGRRTLVTRSSIIALIERQSGGSDAAAS